MFKGCCLKVTYKFNISWFIFFLYFECVSPFHLCFFDWSDKRSHDANRLVSSSKCQVVLKVRRSFHVVCKKGAIQPIPGARLALLSQCECLSKKIKTIQNIILSEGGPLHTSRIVWAAAINKDHHPFQCPLPYFSVLQDIWAKVAYRWIQEFTLALDGEWDSQVHPIYWETRKQHKGCSRKQFQENPWQCCNA